MTCFQSFHLFTYNTHAIIFYLLFLNYISNIFILNLSENFKTCTISLALMLASSHSSIMFFFLCLLCMTLFFVKKPTIMHQVIGTETIGFSRRTRSLCWKFVIAHTHTVAARGFIFLWRPWFYIYFWLWASMRMPPPTLHLVALSAIVHLHHSRALLLRCGRGIAFYHILNKSHSLNWYCVSGLKLFKFSFNWRIITL